MGERPLSKFFEIPIHYPNQNNFHGVIGMYCMNMYVNHNFFFSFFLAFLLSSPLFFKKKTTKNLQYGMFLPSFLPSSSFNTPPRPHPDPQQRIKKLKNKKKKSYYLVVYSLYFFLVFGKILFFPPPPSPHLPPLSPLPSFTKPREPLPLSSHGITL